MDQGSTEIDLSIIIVNWNGCALLKRCIQSLQTLDCPVSTPRVNTEIIVIDNGSQDDSLAMLRRDFPQVLVIANQENHGFARANNQGLMVARGRYCLLLNSDTEVIDDALARLVAFMDTYPRVGACGPQLRNPDGTLQPSGRDFPTVGQATLALLPLPSALRHRLRPATEKRNYDCIVPVDEVSGAALCLRRSALAHVGVLDETFYFFGEDVDLCRRLTSAGWQVYYVPEARIIHVWGGSRKRLSEEMSLHGQRAYVLLMHKHKSRLAAYWLTGFAVWVTLLKAARRSATALICLDFAALRRTILRHRDELTWLFRLCVVPHRTNSTR
jgi:GT2 family glycosyltransferase